jgi:hypothetical protein
VLLVGVEDSEDMILAEGDEQNRWNRWNRRNRRNRRSM